MGKISCASARSAPITISALCALALSAVFAPPAFMQQQGGPYTLHPSVIPSGGGASTNANTRIDGSSGQPITGASTAGSYSLNAGFWPNVEPCPFSLSPLGEFLTQSGGPGSINVVATASCNWTAASADPWIVITSKESSSGNGVVTFEARENFTGSARQTAINISGTNHIIVQDAGLGEDCTYSISPSFRAFPASGGSGTLTVIAEERCAGRAATAESWISVNSINVGIGNGSVVYSIAANPGASGRNGTIIIGAATVRSQGEGDMNRD